MAELKSLDSLFKQSLFRIPDYQRGYSWGREQLDAFWGDLINLCKDRSHYTGVLTLNEISPDKVEQDSKEYWLIKDHSYRLYDIVDGQQRLTTFTLFLQAFIELFRDFSANEGKADRNVYLTETLSISDAEEKYLFKEKPKNGFRTYKFGYSDDNPSYEYMRYRILGEEGGGRVPETFYTLNLDNGKRYFKERLRDWTEKDILGLQEIYRKLTQRFLFNKHVINNEFEVYVAFETMNNRGKDLSKLELLKNRLIYLTTLYTDEELDHAERTNLRNLINDAWKEVYSQLGRNKFKPLIDDEFLKAHWMMYFGYSRRRSRDYIKFLLEEQFTPKRVHHEVVQRVGLEEQCPATIMEADDDNGDGTVSGEPMEVAELQPDQISEYVKSLKSSASHWFSTYYPRKCDNLTEEDIEWIERLNRLSMAYFRPLVMAILKKYDDDPVQRIPIFREIERFIFVVFRMSGYRSHYCESEFRGAVHAIDHGDMDLTKLKGLLEERNYFKYEDFHNLLQKKFEEGQGYYDWYGLRYFLYEYELQLRSDSRHDKVVDWDDLKKNPNDKVSIEHIYPQSETDAWELAFRNISEEQRQAYRNSLGNLLVISSAINSSLKNDAFADKKNPKYSPDGSKLRNGYADGSHSEIEVSRYTDWGPRQIRERGIQLLKFMEERWKISFADDQARERLLFIGTHDGEGTDI